ncbi:hypothetical protein [Cecembia calidifontis]|uniref:DUF3311 domain-containing protein n=1 Tax=Cecembia calidifontis TaxID=1187080 RepID=A0A4Q7P6F4_9BACT|nr:hypothetical protein [Cecembia calidifontis]RZS95653.1 hypothetical protein BC751_1189 [Cecembia calidifontis]
MKEGAKNQYLWGVFFLGLFLLNYPVLYLYNIPAKLAGIPVLFLMVFAFWALIIGLTIWVLRKTNSNKNAQ